MVHINTDMQGLFLRADTYELRNSSTEQNVSTEQSIAMEYSLMSLLRGRVWSLHHLLSIGCITHMVHLLPDIYYQVIRHSQEVNFVAHQLLLLV